ncbi:UNVERIFIED_CONTAM: hypothetical protein HDU68_007242 [Siphonaria sp. JEL0065]|nr:hypothetical protein HDU68_007242 [Siphonaria sp. JEL0065]
MMPSISTKTLQTLPTETLEHILHFLPIGPLLSKLFHVSKRFYSILCNTKTAERHLLFQRSRYHSVTAFIASWSSWKALPISYKTATFVHLIAIDTNGKDVRKSIKYLDAPSFTRGSFVKKIINKHSLKFPHDRFVIAFLIACNLGHSCLVKNLIGIMRDNDSTEKWIPIGMKLGSSTISVVNLFLDDPLVSAVSKSAIKVIFVLNASPTISMASCFLEIREYTAEQITNALTIFKPTSHKITRMIVNSVERDYFSLFLALLQILTSTPSLPTAIGLKSILEAACKSSEIVYLETILGNAFLDVEILPPEYCNNLFESACGNRRCKAAQLLFEDRRIKFTANSVQTSVEKGLKAGNKKLVEYLVKAQSEFRVKELWEVLLAAVTCLNKDAVALLIQSPFVDVGTDNSKLLRDTCKQSSPEIVRLLLSSPKTDPSLFKNEALLNAIQERNIPIIKLLLADPRVDPSDQQSVSVDLSVNAKLPLCGESGLQVILSTSKYAPKAAITNLLLQDPRVEISQNAFLKVCQIPHPEILDIFLQHTPRIRVSGVDSHYSTCGELFEAAFHVACQENNVDVVELWILPKYRHYVSRICLEEALKMSLQKCFVGVATAVLKALHPVNGEFNAKLLHEISQNRIKEVEPMLKAERVDIEILNQHAFVRAAGAVKVRMVLLLLEDGRVDPSRNGNWLLMWASESGRSKVVELLLRDSRVTKFCDLQVPLMAAMRIGSGNVVQMIKSHLKSQ